MATTLTSKGQITIPKHIRYAMHLKPGSAVEFAVDEAGHVMLKSAPFAKRPGKCDRFEAARGAAAVKWRTDDLMRLLRGDA